MNAALVSLLAKAAFRFMHHADQSGVHQPSRVVMVEVISVYICYGIQQSH